MSIANSSKTYLIKYDIEKNLLVFSATNEFFKANFAPLKLRTTIDQSGSVVHSVDQSINQSIDRSDQ